MNFQRSMLYAGLAACALLSAACSPIEPVKGCALAAANQRETLRAQNYLNKNIPARILAMHYEGDQTYHAALIYRLPEGWCAYDDTFGTRALRLQSQPKSFPPPLVAARASSPGHAVDDARWFDETGSRSSAAGTHASYAR